jgi:hypothetical protein
MDPNAVLRLHTERAPVKDIEDTAPVEKKEQTDVTILRTGCPFFYGYKKENSKKEDEKSGDKKESN